MMKLFCRRVSVSVSEKGGRSVPLHLQLLADDIEDVLDAVRRPVVVVNRSDAHHAASRGYEFESSLEGGSSDVVDVDLETARLLLVLSEDLASVVGLVVERDLDLKLVPQKGLRRGMGRDGYDGRRERGKTTRGGRGEHDEKEKTVSESVTVPGHSRPDTADLRRTRSWLAVPGRRGEMRTRAKRTTFSSEPAEAMTLAPTR